MGSAEVVLLVTVAVMGSQPVGGLSVNAATGSADTLTCFTKVSEQTPAVADNVTL